MDRADLHKMLIRGLLHTDELVHLYNTNAQFRAAIRTLADLLGPMVNGLAEESKKVDAHIQAAIQAAMYEAPGIEIDRLLQDLR